MVPIPLFNKDAWRKNVEQLQSTCSRLNGTFVPDDEEKVFACVVSDRNLSITYFRDKDFYLVSLSGDGIIMSSVSKDPPDFVISRKDFAIRIDRPEVTKVYTVEYE